MCCNTHHPLLWGSEISLTCKENAISMLVRSCTPDLRPAVQPGYNPD
jgi:hypothetical protein